MSEERSFIEVQFPVSKVSKESYKERTLGAGQTLTGLGKWWGRKPLILVRAVLLGMLLPATDNAKVDQEIFNKLLMIDEDGLEKRRYKRLTANALYEKLNDAERKRWFTDSDSMRLAKLSTSEKENLQKLVFKRLSYDEKIQLCLPAEKSVGPIGSVWDSINQHLGTSVDNVRDLVVELGIRKFGRSPRVGDVFCGGGSIPFEAARLNCEVFASDLNPIAVLLTWAGFNVIGGSSDYIERVQLAQKRVINRVQAQLQEWGVEHNSAHWQADSYLYCGELVCPECGWRVPLAPSWIIGERTLTVAQLVPDEVNKRFNIFIESDCSEELFNQVRLKGGTVSTKGFTCPNEKCAAFGFPTTISKLRGDRRVNGESTYGLRSWNNSDICPRSDDLFQERLYCIRWIEKKVNAINGMVEEVRHYRAPDAEDLGRELKILAIIQELFPIWQEKGYIPSREIEPGQNTDQPSRERGWNHWHHLFNPRQLLTLGLFAQELVSEKIDLQPALLLGLFKCSDYNARLSQWDPTKTKETVVHTFANQALNTLSNYGARSTLALESSWMYKISGIDEKINGIVVPQNALDVQWEADIWITDPPYADAVNYHELSEFFLAWAEKILPQMFPDWYADSKRALAITGSSDSFRKKMADCYHNLAIHMPENGMQIVMFTHQDASVWADLALILWSAGLRVTAAWCIATETNSSLKQGNYVQGTVLLVLRKQITEDTAFLDEIYPQVDEEVKKQLAEMSALDDKEDPNFSDTDYQLAAYAAALRVLTSYRRIEEIDVQRELVKVRAKGEVSPLEEVIREAVKIACNYQIPTGLDKEVWRGLSADERFYIKGLELESHGEYRTGAYQEFAKGFGIKEYSFMLSSGKANQTRLKTASEFAGRNLGGEGFASSLTRHALYAVRETAASGETGDGRNWFRNELGARYWAERKNLVGILNYFASFAHSANMPQWQKDAGAAKLLAVAVENDHV